MTGLPLHNASSRMSGGCRIPASLEGPPSVVGRAAQASSGGGKTARSCRAASPPITRTPAGFLPSPLHLTIFKEISSRGDVDACSRLSPPKSLGLRRSREIQLAYLGGWR